MSFSPVLASKNIVEKYKCYLSTIFEIYDSEYSQILKDELKDLHSFAKGPFLDVTDSFVKGKNINELVMENILNLKFNKINMPSSRPLYKHQQEAIELIIKGKNVVVSTGTGSGKTESFLIPIINHIIIEEETNTLSDGVRALIVYPMNALANDQIERLRDVLSEYPQITFGSYTGQTKLKYFEAIAEYKNLNNGEIPKSNELISREQMKETPPHILITNYAMLEYLMLRPDDSIFFGSEYSNKWKFIVLDEAHVYTGSTGIEVSMLLRRLKATLKNQNIQYVLTSATLGGDNDNEDVAKFASNLCDSPFDSSNIIRAYRNKPKKKPDLNRLPLSFYKLIAAMINENYDPISIGSKIFELLKSENKGQSYQELLYDCILNDENYWDIRLNLDSPQTVKTLSNNLGWEENEVEDFVTVASKCEKSNDRLFDARYHMFLRATESVFITLPPKKNLFLTRKESHNDSEGLEYKIFEIATCTSCHAIYLTGKVVDNYLVQNSSMQDNMEKAVFLLSDIMSDTDEDHMLENEKIETDEFEICSRCGIVRKIGANKNFQCEHEDKYYSKVIKATVKNDSGKLTKCLACENSNSFGMLRMFFTGQEAVTSVIGTSLFEELPSYKIVRNFKIDNDDSGFGVSNDYIENTLVREAKQFIAFSDSRQAAAFYASYLDQTYRNILYKRLIVETMKEKDKENYSKNLPYFVEDLIRTFEANNIAIKNTELTKKESWKAILQEIVDNNGSTSLYNTGLLGISLDSAYIPQNDKLGLTKEEVVSICSVFALGMMADAAIYYETILTKADSEFFTHKGIENSYTLSNSNGSSYLKSFIPTKSNMNNKRLDYLSRVLSKMGFSFDKVTTTEYLKSIWERIFCSKDSELVKQKDGKFKLNLDKMIVFKNKQWYQCSKCRKITIHNVHGVCPTYRCEGELKEIDVKEEFSENHYYKLYQNLDIRELRVVEHTAQLSKETAYDFQKKFKQKEIDILSCSTTFEMGVDVGSLETVFMRNMPPSPANYAQRAGRAGRTAQSAAYALTFSNKSNHDFAYFNTPERMIKGKINPPKFNLLNEKIAIRHLYASALSIFWKKYPRYFSKTIKMTEASDQEPSGYNAFIAYLSSKPEEIRIFAENFLPELLYVKLKVENFEWVDGLISKMNDSNGVLTKAIAEYEYEVGVINVLIENSINDKKFWITKNLNERLNVYKNEDIIAFLSRKNVLPKYGFPVDTVELNIVDTTGGSKLGLQLQRDLSMALSEYAPGSQIVANGNLITSRYIRKIPNMSWKMYDYVSCLNCNTLNIEPHKEGDENSFLLNCKQCGSTFGTIRKGTFLIPSFGFEADGEKIEKPSLIKPERTNRSEIAYVGYLNEIEAQTFQIKNSEIELYMSQNDEMAVLNESRFFVCESCGFTDLDEKCYSTVKKFPHKTSNGYHCKNDGSNRLKRYSLGYRFETDVVQLRFLNPDLIDYEVALSVLNGVIRGTCSYLNIEQNDISGCLQFFFNKKTRRNNYAIVLYDKTPGGAGHVRRLNNLITLEGVLEETLTSMKSCDCGGDKGDSSCYSCLRSYYNQKFHDLLKRSDVISFITKVLNENIE